MHGNRRFLLRPALLVVVLLSCLAVFFPPPQAQAGWRDKLKQAGKKARDKLDGAKEKWKERERKCSECGKTIHLGTKCATCQAKGARKKWQETKPKLQKSADRVKQKWEGAKPKLRDAAQSAREKAKEYAPKIRDAARKTSERIRAYGPKLKDAAARTKQKWEDLKPQIQDARLRASDWYGKHKDAISARSKDAIRQYGPKISAAIRDPENRRKAFETVGTVLEVRRQLKATQRETTRRALDLAFKLPVRTRSGEMTLGDLAKDRLVGRFPVLEGTDIVEDPAGPLTALITSDKRYFLTEFRFVKSGGERVSVVQAARNSSAFNTDKAMRCLDLMEATESVTHAVTTGEGSLDALQRTVSAMSALNRD